MSKRYIPAIMVSRLYVVRLDKRTTLESPPNVRYTVHRVLASDIVTRKPFIVCSTPCTMFPKTRTGAENTAADLERHDLAYPSLHVDWEGADEAYKSFMERLKRSREERKNVLPR